jgi:transcriptional regulator with XRE-family HTH domain
MNIYDLLRQALKAEYDKNNTTQEALGERAGISQQHINRLLSGRSSFANLKFETLLKLLPGIRITLDGSPVHGHFQNVNGNGNIVAGHDAHATTCAAEIESFRSGLVMEIIALDIELAAKDQVLRLVRDFRKQRQE